MLEDLAWDELDERLRARGLEARRHAAGAGRVRLEHAEQQADEVLAQALELRSIHHVLRPLVTLELGPEPEPLAPLLAAVGGLPLPELSEGPATERSFRVSCQRQGQHAFRSPDVERAVGAAVVASTGAPVDLTGFRHRVRVDVVEGEARVSLQLTRRALSQRHERPFQPRVVLQANVAYALLRLAGVGPQAGLLVDPFCGSGTILLEAGDLYPSLELWGGDSHEGNVAGASQNLAAAGLGGRAQLAVSDARQLDEHFDPGSVGAIVTNPPLGARLGQRIDFPSLYERFLRAARRVIREDGVLTLLAKKRRVFQQAVKRAGGWRIVYVQMVDMSGVVPAAYVLRPV